MGGGEKNRSDLLLSLCYSSPIVFYKFKMSPANPKTWVKTMPQSKNSYFSVDRQRG